MRWMPDWLVYAIVLIAVLVVVFRSAERVDAPPALDRELLPPPSLYNPETLVQVGPVQSGVGTAFAIDKSGLWLTARHVVQDCDEVGLVVAAGLALPVRKKLSEFTDLALLQTDGAPSALLLDRSEDDFTLRQDAYHVGFPGGSPGEVASRLLGRERLVVRGRYAFEQPVMAWAERGRTRGLSGSLAGMSGGPVLDSNGMVIGVTIAESARRGRIYTVGPDTIHRFLEIEGVQPTEAAPAGEIHEDGARAYGRVADELRRTLAVAQVVCMVGEE